MNRSMIRIINSLDYVVSKKQREQGKMGISESSIRKYAVIEVPELKKHRKMAGKCSVCHEYSHRCAWFNSIEFGINASRVSNPPPPASDGGWWLATILSHLEKSVHNVKIGGWVARWLGGWWLGDWWLGGQGLVAWWLVVGGWCPRSTHTCTLTHTINTEKKELIYFLQRPWCIKFLEKMESCSKKIKNWWDQLFIFEYPYCGYYGDAPPPPPKNIIINKSSP